MEDPTRLAQDRLAELIAEADGDDATLLRILAHEAEGIAVYSRRLDLMRDQAVARLRHQGVPLTRIAVFARVSDSYLSRRLRKWLHGD